MTLSRSTALSLIAGGVPSTARPVAAQTAPVVKIGAQAIDAAGEAFYGTDAGIFATAKWANTHTAESAPMLAKASKMDPAVVAQMKRLYFATSNERRYVEPILNVAAKYGGLPRPVPFAEYSAYPGS